MNRPFAVFDIDGTLIRWQLYHLIVDKLAKEGALGPDAHQKLHDARMVWKRREYAESFKAYEKALIEIYEQAIKNIKSSAFDSYVLEVVEEYKDQTYVYTRNLVKELKAKNYFLLAISGSHHELVEQIARYYGFDDWQGTQYERKGEGFSGRKFVASLDKKRGLETMVAKHHLSYKNSLAIGDSASDAPMLELVEQPLAFNPDRSLLTLAMDRGWSIIVERKNVIYELDRQHGQYILAQAG
jgi:HAD superfamily hydrolase (TIGR01490 family)